MNTALTAVYVAARNEIAAGALNLDTILKHATSTLHKPVETKHTVYETTFSNEGVIEMMIQLSNLAKSWGYRLHAGLQRVSLRTSRRARY